MRRDLHGSRTASERNPNLATPTRRNYGSRRRKPLLPLETRIERLKRHFAGKEHFAGAEYPPPKPFDMDNHFHLQMAVIECIHRQRLSVAQTAELLDTTEREIEFTLDIIKQNAE